MRAAVYVRLSQATETNRLNLIDQQTDCEKLCADRGWHVTEVFTDDDRSAYSGKPRPAYDRMLQAARAGHINAIVAKANDRLHRTPVELERFITLIESTGAAVAVCPEGGGEDYDLTSSDGRFKARIVGAVARKESEDKSRRIKRKHLQKARLGMPNEGGTRPFGFQRDRTKVDLAEAELVREAARRVIGGEAVGAVLADWNRRGVPTVTGKPWRTTVLRNLLTSTRIAGKRFHKGAVHDASWPAIITDAEHIRLKAILFDPARRKGGHPREYLLTGGLAVCGLCDRPLVARPKADGRRAYYCARGVDHHGCGKIGQLADPLEELVSEAVIVRLSSPGVVKALARPGADHVAEAQLADIEEAIGELDTDYYRHRKLSRERYEALIGDLEQARRRVTDVIVRVASPTVLDDLPRAEEELRKRWAGRPMSWRRVVAAVVLERVTVGPAVAGRNFFDPDRISLMLRA